MMPVGIEPTQLKRADSSARLQLVRGLLHGHDCCIDLAERHQRLSKALFSVPS